MSLGKNDVWYVTIKESQEVKVRVEAKTEQVKEKCWFRDGNLFKMLSLTHSLFQVLAYKLMKWKWCENLYLQWIMDDTKNIPRFPTWWHHISDHLRIIGQVPWGQKLAPSPWWPNHIWRACQHEESLNPRSASVEILHVGMKLWVWAKSFVKAGDNVVEFIHPRDVTISAATWTKSSTAAWDKELRYHYGQFLGLKLHRGSGNMRQGGVSLRLTSDA